MSVHICAPLILLSVILIKVMMEETVFQPHVRSSTHSDTRCAADKRVHEAVSEAAPFILGYNQEVAVTS